MAGGFYSRYRRPGGYNHRVLASLNAYPKQRAGMAIVRRDFGHEFGTARRKFEGVFGPVGSEQPVYLIDSMGELDGGIRELNGKRTLLFGIDVIADEHASRNMSAFFYHELFHVYHEPKITECAAMWCAMWVEGLATYAASRLAPGASDDELILNLPNPIRPAVEADRRGAVCAIADRLQSTSDEDFSALFQGDDRLPGFPSRMGYYVGFLVAKDIGRTHGLRQMADMGWVEAKPLIDSSLARMADCRFHAAERMRTEGIGWSQPVF